MLVLFYSGKEAKCDPNSEAKIITFFQIYSFLDSDFSNLIENRNHFQFSQAVCAKSSGKFTCLKLWEISIMFIPL
jgi:hypothetical protein